MFGVPQNPWCIIFLLKMTSLTSSGYPQFLDIPTDHQLAGGAITILKNDGLRQWEGLFPTEWKVIKFMVETKNQLK